MPEKYKTVVFDSAGELARLLFSWEMKKKSSDMETIRQPQTYPGMTERLNMFVRRLKSFRDEKHVNIVITAHEDIQRIYAKGGMITPRGQVALDPIAVRGWLDIPGSTAPQEVERAVDNIFRVRYVNRQLYWIARPEPIGPGAGDWEVKDRFGAREYKDGLLPASYSEIREIFKDSPNWSDWCIWVIYGVVGLEKTRRVAATFPEPMKIFDLDKGTQSIRDICLKRKIDIVQFDVEEFSEYMRFTKEVGETYDSL